MNVSHIFPKLLCGDESNAARVSLFTVLLHLLSCYSNLIAPSPTQRKATRRPHGLYCGIGTALNIQQNRKDGLLTGSENNFESRTTSGSL